MTSAIQKTIIISLAGAALMLGGCASVEEVHHAQATADHAQATADEALGAAHHAQQTADQALTTAQTSQQGVDELKNSSTSHRGPRG